MDDRKYLPWLIIESCDNDDGGFSKHCEAGLAELDDGTLSFVQGGAGLRETEFTMGEIKQRHLENCEREEVIDDDAKK